MTGCDDIEADQLLFAIGRQPNTEGLGLEAVGVELGDKGQIKVDADNRTSVPSIFAVGDVTDRVQLTPVAIREGQAFADTFFGNKPTPGRLRLHPVGGVQPSAARRRRPDRRRRRATSSARSRPTRRTSGR